MRIIRQPFISVLLLTVPFLAIFHQDSNPAINSPQAGDALQGVVTVVGSSNLSGFASAQLSFSYIDDPTDTWFLIATLSQPVLDQTLVNWDTTSISDGNYTLRLRVILTDGSTHDVLVPGLRVRNYTPVETPTPAPTVPQATPLPTITQTPTLFPTPTLIPQNPAVLATTDVSFSIIYGGSGAILLFIIIAIYLWLRRNL
jgi:hypothetical protein